MNIETLRSFIRVEILNDETISIEADDDLLATGTLDSMGVARLVEYVEGELDVAIPVEDVTLENFQSLNQITAYLATMNR